uniref:NADH-ubiquinone oxidoreductase chain 3 n=1 Tax=Encyrtus eulecaniumiae TaxID=1914888 RepID=A0A7S5FMS6_9HYME|nr:NADH dehydrogenase subunit 3 [Encyrtus eulecaniumiae]QGA74463.1 NADH dehydrogenase subunit 3 [Encyrtus eulecaniumiae]QGA74476.1 NADH dehydrogenase subunit 3 [Encyrtus eulecaniumiae]QGA74489.1 NADH dehydrogenase subunit 3 [Encyrtus eulecaniumiae]QGA74502.1 NADH dehydrogenase subunit 3 [Encyrtus eulecaniumiae]
MLFLLSLILICMLLVFFMFVLNVFFSKKLIKNREKMSPFECGFDSMSVSRLPFSLQFYLVSVIFLIFDVEIALIMPLVYLNYLTYSFMIFTIFFILLVLLGGLYLEWLEGALMWFK